MATDYRSVRALQLLIQVVPCVCLTPGKIKAIILTIHGHKIPTEKQRKPLKRLLPCRPSGKNIPYQNDCGICTSWVERLKLLLRDTALLKSQAIQLK